MAQHPTPTRRIGAKSLVLASLFAIPAQAQTAERDVRAVMEGYIAASRGADASIARPLFHPKAIMTGLHAGGRIYFGTPANFFAHLDRVAAAPRKPYGPARVAQVTVVGDIATGTVEESDFDGKRYTEMFQLIHEDGRWLIVSKIWYGTPAG